MESFCHHENGGQRVSKSKRQYIAHDDEQKSFSNKALYLTSYLELKTRAIGTDGHFYECVKCEEVGNLLCCDTCACTYHLHCLSPPLECVPKEDWQCPNCYNIDNLSEDVMTSYLNCSLCSKIKKILISSDHKEEISKSCSTNQPNLSNGFYKRVTKYHGGPSFSGVDIDVSNLSILRAKHDSRQKGKGIMKNTPRNKKGTCSSLKVNVQMRSSNLQVVKYGENVRFDALAKKGIGAQRSTLMTSSCEDITIPSTLLSKKNGADTSGHASSKSYGKNIDTLPTSVEKVTWSGFELDALWVGVRRYGQENWDTILADSSMSVLKYKTPQDLRMKWKEELHKILSSFQKATPIGIMETPPFASSSRACPSFPKAHNDGTYNNYNISSCNLVPNKPKLLLAGHFPINLSDGPNNTKEILLSSRGMEIEEKD
ncbi:protein CHROMATIN REMODELING 4 isoform X1 [Senna tora]|uniref:Protein CHROMATIN REMODELING 4 isoform X1 n=1 Tax=Senna tora TaxID=362788 RepID=A0A834SYU2_9FABA|nr:protein CHROMATIN REMODELING 4 isoform X1 [Senna tora]